jgi:hypothetical protein
MASQKGVTGVDFRKGLKASEEQKRRKGIQRRKLKTRESEVRILNLVASSMLSIMDQ